mgnify:FL=1
MFIIYQIINLTNTHRYVGYTSRTVKTRWLHHISLSKKGSNRYLHCAIRKYGAENFKLEVLEEGWNTEIGKNIREPYWISVLKPEYNHTKGGEGTLGVQHTPEWCRKHSDFMRILSSSPEWKIHKSKEMHRKQCGLGYHHTSEFKLRQSISTSKQMIGNRYALGVKHTKVTCPSCNFTGAGGAMKRFHFDNCKLKKV